MIVRLKLLFFVFLVAGSFFVQGQNHTEILGRPTDTSITVSVLFDQTVDLYIEYGNVSGVYTGSTAQITNVSGTPDEIDLQDLWPDTEYFYRIRYRLTGLGTFLSSAEHSFHTQRAPGSSFVFTIESDVHLYDKKGCNNEYNITLANEAADHPDFMIDMGDTYGDDHKPFTITAAQVDSLHKVYRPFLGSICHSIPYYFCMGNHEGEMNYYLDSMPPNNLGAWGTLARKKYFACPYPNNFYSGNTDNEPYGMGNPENYYAWTWGDALFVVLDVYRYQSISDTTPKPQKWDWTLGFAQYTWLKNTLENSTATYKFVFAHQIRGQGRGGVLDAPYYEWGGLDGNGNNLFATKRPGWAKPIHQLFVDNGVNVFFHGHDHLFSHEVLDSVVYLEVPMPSDSTYEIGMLANASAYAGDTADGSGHIRVSVTPSCVTIDYVRAYLPADTVSGMHHNRELAFSFTVGSCQTTGIKENGEIPSVEIYPNPATDYLNVILPDEIDEKGHVEITLTNTLGQPVLQTRFLKFNLNNIPNGLYFVKIHTDQGEFENKIIINR